jgi:hypothetical protein
MSVARCTTLAMVRATSLLQASVGTRGLDLRAVRAGVSLKKHLGPHRLAVRPPGNAPAQTESRDQHEPAPAFGVVIAWKTRVGGRDPVGAGVGELDTEDGRTAEFHGEVKPEVPAGGAAVGDGVGGQLGDDEGGNIGRVTPSGEVLGGADPGEVGATAGRTEKPSELPLCAWHLLVHGNSIGA